MRVGKEEVACKLLHLALGHAGRLPLHSADAALVKKALKLQGASGAHTEHWRLKAAQRLEAAQVRPGRPRKCRG